MWEQLGPVIKLPSTGAAYKVQQLLITTPSTTLHYTAHTYSWLYIALHSDLYTYDMKQLHITQSLSWKLQSPDKDTA